MAFSALIDIKNQIRQKSCLVVDKKIIASSINKQKSQNKIILSHDNYEADKHQISSDVILPKKWRSMNLCGKL